MALPGSANTDGGAATLDLTVVVCNFNMGMQLKDCLDAVQENQPASIVFVDAGSTDNSVEIAANYTDRILFDEGRGLANARNMGIDAAETRYVAFVGPDNIMLPGSLAAMIQTLEESGSAIVSAVTILRDTGNYWGWAQNAYRIARYKPGIKPVVGTPTLFNSKLAQRYKYSTFMKNSDDTEICERMKRDGHHFAIADTQCYEIGFDTWAAIWERWTRYGRGDYLFYTLMKGEWSLFRRFKSFLHPLEAELVSPLTNMTKPSDILFLPFLLIIVTLRYFGWLRSWVTRVDNSRSAIRSL
jgi:glycosyltransferase involved in cell wall biosynthesis